MSPSVKGRYEGRAVVELLDEGRVVSLVEAFSYIDYLSQRWDVPSGARVDGASIPRALWTLVGAPFEGKYRNASIIHDWFCDRRTRPWQRVHEIFYEAMLTSGVSAVQARILYTGVRFGGPRWSATAVANNNLSGGAALPSAPMAAPTSRPGGFNFAGPKAPARGGDGPRPAKRPVPKPARTVKPAAYRYDLSEADMNLIKGIAAKDLKLSEIDKLVEQELKGRKRQ